MILDFLFVLFLTFFIIITFFIFAMMMKFISHKVIEYYLETFDMKIKLVINKFAQKNLWLVDATKRILKTNLDRNYRRNLMVILYVSDNLKLEYYGNVKGFIIHEDTKYDNVFTINLDSELSSKLMLSTLCHELSHLVQYVEGRHRTYIFNNIKYELWNGINYGPKDSIEYSKRPWEIEATAMEEKFVDDYYR